MNTIVIVINLTESKSITELELANFAECIRQSIRDYHEPLVESIEYGINMDQELTVN